MTTVSTAAAIGMMPLNLLIYSRYWIGSESIIPYLDIFTTLLTTAIPAFFGILLQWFKPKIAIMISKVSGKLTPKRRTAI